MAKGMRARGQAALCLSTRVRRGAKAAPTNGRTSARKVGNGPPAAMYTPAPLSPRLFSRLSRRLPAGRSQIDFRSISGKATWQISREFIVALRECSRPLRADTMRCRYYIYGKAVLEKYA